MMTVADISRREAINLIVAYHYMHRVPPISFAFGLFESDDTKGCITFGTPASRHMLIGACKESPSSVIELNRLWVADEMPRNTESWFVSRALKMLPARIVLSYADTAAGHAGYIYRAANFYYAGWTDMDRHTPRFDYLPISDARTADFFDYQTPQKHTRDAYRSGIAEKKRRKPKVKYWTVTGNRRDRKRLEAICLWPKLNWKETPPPMEAA